ncbi:hypothetical protein QEN19_000654 [Hanseniaspora menglaensis]
MSSTRTYSLTEKDSIICIFGSVLIAIGSGTVYCYSYYNSQLFVNCKIPLDQISKLSLALSVGSSLFGLVVGPLIDKFGVNKMSYFGGFETFLGYLILLKNYQLKSDCSIFFICVSLTMIGMGSISGFYSCVKCVTYNFPNSRGLAGSIPVSCYALSSLLFSTFFKYFVKNDIELVFKIFMLTCSLMICIGGFLIFLRDYERLEEKDNANIDDNDSNGLPFSNNLSSSSTSTISVTKPMSINKKTRNQSFTKELQGSLKFWGLGRIRETPESVIEQPNIALLAETKGRHFSNASFSENNQANRRESIISTIQDNDRSAYSSPLIHAKPALKISSSNNKDNDVVSFDLETGNHESIVTNNFRRKSLLEPTKTNLIQHSSTKDLPIYQTLTSWKFVGYYTILALLQGIGQTYIYSVGFIVQLIASESDDDVFVDAAAIQSVQVSLIAVFSFAGRLLAGPISDRFVMQKAQRKWNIIVASCFMAAASIAITHFKSYGLSSKIKWLNFCSCVFAFGFGITFGTYPAIIVDAFGTELFSSIWGIITTGGLLSVKFFSKILSSDLKKDNCAQLGNRCVMRTFNTTLLCSIIAMSMTGLMIYLKYQKRKERLARYNHDI